MDKFYSKVILFGEYSVLKGGQLLAMPFNKFYGQLKHEELVEKRQIYSNQQINIFHDYLKTIKFNAKPKLDLLKQDILNGLWFDSNIPEGYGIGSSGALVAAIYTNHFNNIDYTDHNVIQQDLAKMESYFHGKSSGSDPLISFLNQALLINGDISPKVEQLKLLVPFLIDTQKVAKTDDFVSSFLKNKNQSLIKAYIEISNLCINQYLTNHPSLFNTITRLSTLQKQVLKDMFIVPNNLEELALKHNNNLTLKLCGSGGGGFLLAFAKTDAYKTISTELNSLNIPHFALY